MADPNCPKIAYSINEASASSSLGRSKIYALIAAGELRAVKVGGRTLIPFDSLISLIAAAAPIKRSAD